MHCGQRSGVPRSRRMTAIPKAESVPSVASRAISASNRAAFPACVSHDTSCHVDRAIAFRWPRTSLALAPDATALAINSDHWIKAAALGCSVPAGTIAGWATARTIAIKHSRQRMPTAWNSSDSSAWSRASAACVHRRHAAARRSCCSSVAFDFRSAIILAVTPTWNESV